MAIDRTSGVTEAPLTTEKTRLRSFCGASNVYRRFIKDFAKRFRPLNSMLKKGSEPDWGSPTEEQAASFNALKPALTSPPVLSLPRKGRPFMIDTDARNYAMGATLLQQQDKSDARTWATI